MEPIRSASNAALKRVRAVAAGKERTSILLEGERLVSDALLAGVALEIVLVAEGRGDLLSRFESSGGDVRAVDDGLLASASGLRTSPGVLALAPRPAPADLSVLAGSSRSRVAIVAGISDPGNLGALARSAEATGCEALAVVSGGARPWSDKALRGSMGSLLRLPVLEFDSATAAEAQLRQRGYRQLRAATRGGAAFDECDWSGPLALWFPHETGDLPAELESLEPVTIPMSGRIESLNVAVAASVLLFAAARAQDRQP